MILHDAWLLWVEGPLVAAVGTLGMLYVRESRRVGNQSQTTEENER